MRSGAGFRSPTTPSSARCASTSTAASPAAASTPATLARFCAGSPTASRSWSTSKPAEGSCAIARSRTTSMTARPGDAFADLYVEWERSAPIERVWSPATGTVAAPYEHWRQGDHEREGMMLAVGPGIRSGRRRGTFESIDIGATFAAAVDVPLPDADGRPIGSVLPDGVRRPLRGARAVGAGQGAARPGDAAPAPRAGYPIGPSGATRLSTGCAATSRSAPTRRTRT